MKRLVESNIEQFAIEQFEKQDYYYIYAPEIAPDSETPERYSSEDVLLIDQIK